MNVVTIGDMLDAAFEAEKAEKISEEDMFERINFEEDSEPKFDFFVDRKSYLSAAQALVPTGAFWGVGNNTDDCVDPDKYGAHIIVKIDGEMCEFLAFAATPALALLAVVLKARSAGAVGGND